MPSERIFFLQNTKLTRVTGYVFATCIFDGHDQLGLNNKNVREQWYDGTSNISCEWIVLQIDWLSAICKI